MTKMSVVFYKYRMVIALLSGFFGVYFNFMGVRFSKFGLFSIGFLTMYFVSLSVAEVIVTTYVSDTKGEANAVKHYWMFGIIVISLGLSLCVGYFTSILFRIQKALLSRAWATA